jgi:hypothetical protein
MVAQAEANCLEAARTRQVLRFFVLVENQRRAAAAEPVQEELQCG